jgi:TRAP-type C4-dicarboxylate transport system substrate-binding protein
VRESKSVRWCVHLCAALLLVLGLFATVCGHDPTHGSDRVYRLKLSSHIPANAPPARVTQEWADKVAEATAGRVQFTIYPAESLAKGKEALQATEDGVCDAAMINLAYVAKRWSLNSVLTLGTLSIPEVKGVKVWDELAERFPEMRAEMSSVKILGKAVGTSTALHIKGRDVSVPADLKGLRIAALGESILLAQASGAIAVNLSASDWATAAAKGLIVGCVAPAFVITDRGLQTTFDHHVDLGVGAGVNVIVMNWDVWNALPADVQAVLDGLSPWLNAALLAAFIEVDAQGWQECRGQTVVRPTGEDLAAWKACFQPVAERWIAGNAGKGQSRAIYDYLTQLLER